MLTKMFFRTHTSFIIVLASLILIAGFILPGCKNKDPLTPGERTWLKQHSGQITINNEKGWPPIIDTDINGYPIGIAIDYYRLLEQKLDFKFKLDKLDTWANVVNKLQNNKIEVICEMQKSPERSKYALFTKPYIEIPNVIIVRKEHKSSFALENMRDMKIAVSKGYAITNFIKTNYSYLHLVFFNEDTSCLNETVTKNVDAAVMNLAVASYLIEKQGITNLRIAGYADYTNALCFASRKDWPILNSILEKGLALITQAEKNAIYQNWISLGLEYKPFYKNRQFLIVSGSIAGVIIAIIFAILIWNQSLKKQVKFRTENLKSTNIQLKNEIAERNKVEKELRDSQQLNETILNASPDIIYIYDILKKVNIYSNEGIMPVLGYSITEIKNMEDQMIQTLMYPDDFQIYLNETVPKYQSAKDNEFIEHEYRMKHKNGQWCWLVSKESIFLRHKNGNPKQIFGMVSDITNRKLAEMALSQEKERLMVTLRSIGDGVITTDTNGRVLLINKIAEKLTGWTQLEALNKDIKDVFKIINSQTGTKCENPVEKVLEAKTIVGLANHTVLISRDGTERMIADSGAPIFDASSEIIGVVLVFRDVTEKHKIEMQLQQSQKMEAIGTLAGGIAHDFNNMLGAITGNISYALSLLNKDDELFEVLSDAQESSKQAQNLTHQLLTFSKGGAPIKKVSNLNRLIKESTIFALRGAKTNCSFELANDLWSTEVDEGQINQAIGNLVINANQAMPNGGIITIRTKNTEIEYKSDLPLSRGRYINIVIEDQGVGISKKYLLNIFDPYFTTKQKGSGLGLATTYSTIKRHGGHIAVYSETEKGTVFNIYLPASLKDAKEIEYKEAPKHTGNGKILIMDDQKPILKMASRMLNRMGYETELAIDGTEAIRKYREKYQSQNPFDLVFLDLTIPGGMGGADTIIELLKIDPDVCAVVSSGYSNDPIMANYEDYGFCGVVPKPYTKDQLSEVLNKIFL